MWDAARPPKVVGGHIHLGGANYEESAVGNTTDVHGEPRVDGAGCPSDQGGFAKEVWRSLAPGAQAGELRRGAEGEASPDPRANLLVSRRSVESRGSEEYDGTRGAPSG